MNELEFTMYFWGSAAIVIIMFGIVYWWFVDKDTRHARKEQEWYKISYRQTLRLDYMYDPDYAKHAWDVRMLFTKDRSYQTDGMKSWWKEHKEEIYALTR